MEPTTAPEGTEPIQAHASGQQNGAGSNGHTKASPGRPTDTTPGERRDSRRRRCLALADVAAIGVAALAIWLAGWRPPGEALLVTLPCWVLLNKLLGLYDRDANVIHKSTLDEAPRLLQSALIGTALGFLTAPLSSRIQLSGAEGLLFAAMAFLGMALLRGFVRIRFGKHPVRERCLILGSDAVAQSLAAKLRDHPESGVEIVGFVDAQGALDDETAEPGPALAGHIGEFEQVCRALDVERVIVAFSAVSQAELQGVVRLSKRLGLKITVVPRLFEVMSDSVEFDSVSGMTLLGLRGLARTRSSLALKRAVDIGGAATALVVVAPVLLAIALAIKLTSRGPVLFRQRRIGRGNHPFTLYKFRTMHVGADELKEALVHLNEAPHPMFKIADDPRVTRGARFLRRHSLDELPQLWNVLAGEMSLVGPRPLVPAEDDHVIGAHRARLELTPGVTGPWQVLGRTAIPFEEMVKLDYLYVAEWSLWNDFKLLIRTAPVVFAGRGQ